MTELRDVWHRFAAGQAGPEMVVGAAQRACSAGAHNSAPTLLELANVQPAQYAYVPQIFDRVRAELQAASARAVQTPQQVAYAAGATAAQPVSYAPPQPPYGQQPIPQPPYGAPGAYPMHNGYIAPAPMHMPPAEPGLPPGVHGLTLKKYRDLKRAGWICAIVSWFILWPLGLAAVHNGVQLAKAGESQGIAMAVCGGLAAIAGLFLVGTRFSTLG